MFNSKSRLTLVLLLFTLVPFSQPWAADGEKGLLVAELIRNMGYGAAIHHFKNYVLRGKEKYRTGAEENFSDAAKTLADLRASDGLTTEEQHALEEIGKVVEGYRSQLPTIQSIYEQEKSLARILKQVDQRVKIDDTPAVEGIALLRNSYGPWSHVEEIEYAMGYGAAIHNFKNYVIRQSDKYRERADSWLATAATEAEKLRNGDDLNEKQSAALKTVENTIRAYQRALPRVQSTLEPAEKSANDTVVNIAVRGADKAVKIDDSPAVEALRTLRVN